MMMNVRNKIDPKVRTVFSKLTLKIHLAILPLVFIGIFSLSSLNFKDAAYAGDYNSELVKAYNTLANYATNGALYELNELASDEIVVPQRGTDWFDGGQEFREHQQTYLPTEFTLSNAWQQLYAGITICNKQLFQYSKITTPDVDIYVAELRVLRAYYYYLLLDAFRNVLLI